MAISKDAVKAAAKAAGKRHNQNEKTSSSIPLPPEGVSLGRFVEYVELGVQNRKAFKGQEKPPIEQVKLGFELLSSKNVRTIKVKDKKTGKEVEKEVADRISMQPIPLSLHTLAKFNEIYEQMRKASTNPDEVTHMAELLGEPFSLTIEHNKSNGKTYANIASISAPINPESGKRYKVRDALTPLRLFLWDDPTQEQWDSIFIAGTKKGKEGEEEQSRNWLQEKILSANNYEGSPIDQLLSGLDSAVEGEETEEGEEEAEDEDADETAEDAEEDDESTEEDDDAAEDSDEEDEEGEDADEDEAEEEVKPTPKKSSGKPTAKASSKTSAKPSTTSKPSAKGKVAPAKATGKKPEAKAKSSSQTTKSPSKGTSKTTAEEALADIGLFGEEE